MRPQLILLSVLALSAIPATATARAPPASTSDESARDFSFVVMPISIANPSVGTGAAVGVLALYKVDGSARPWSTVLGGLYTDTQTWGAVVGQKAYLDQDRYRVTAGVGGGMFNTEFFGIGQGAGGRGVGIPISETGKGGLAQVLVRVAPQVYLGPEFRYVHVRTSLDLANIRFRAQRLQSFELDSTVSALGLAGEYDTRDDEYSPSKGLYGKAVWMRAAESLGSDRGVDRAEASLNGGADDGLQCPVRARPRSVNGHAGPSHRQLGSMLGELLGQRSRGRLHQFERAFGLVAGRVRHRSARPRMRCARGSRAACRRSGRPGHGGVGLADQDGHRHPAAFRQRLRRVGVVSDGRGADGGLRQDAAWADAGPRSR